MTILLKRIRKGTKITSHIAILAAIAIVFSLTIGEVVRTLHYQSKSTSFLETSDELHHLLLLSNENETMPKSPPTLYFCIGGTDNGMREYTKLMQSALPEYKLMDFSVVNKFIHDEYLVEGYTNEYDVFFTNHHPSSCSNVALQWMLTQFSGHVVLLTGESNFKNPITKVDREHKFHYFGAAIHPREHDMRLTYLQLTWFDHFQEALTPATMVDPALRPRNNGRNDTTYMIYANSNCVPFRQDAVGRLSHFGKIHCDGKCQGNADIGNSTNLERTTNGIGIRNWWQNTQLYSKYRFCFVMEHEQNHPAYVTEKIAMAFIGGCIPIYYGPDMIFDMFNEKAFVFYNISNPEPALKMVEMLENNETLYEQMMNEPIAANGNATIEKYFSFSDDIGNGFLKREIRKKLGLLSTKNK